MRRPTSSQTGHLSSPGLPPLPRSGFVQSWARSNRNTRARSSESARLFVVPEYRRKGAGAALVAAIEDQARQREFSRLYLYTTDAAGFYARLGWAVLDRTNWKGFDTALMVRNL
ncbi:GNAT family N-acetyltransferase [Bradyrhizobium zhanjiangense]|uniref:GNAT family N-acetyltransferase n=1 Tax=Bradyrhizobium zhanjiangense TaxID=1325107 RepID=UPI0013E8BB39